MLMWRLGMPKPAPDLYACRRVLATALAILRSTAAQEQRKLGLFLFWQEAQRVERPLAVLLISLPGQGLVEAVEAQLRFVADKAMV